MYQSDLHLLNAIVSGVFAVKSDGTIVCWNTTMEYCTGIKSRDAIGQSILSVVPRFAQDGLWDRIDSVIHDNLPVILSSKLHPHLLPSPHGALNDAVHEIKITSFLHQETNTMLAVFTVEDVTEITKRLIEQRTLYMRAVQEIKQRRIAEEELKLSQAKLQELLRTKDRFFSIIAHDLKSPFASLISYSQFMLSQPEGMNNDQIRTLLETIRDMADTGFGLLENLLTWSRLHTGSMEFTRDSYPIAELVSQAVKDVRTQSKQKSVQITVSVPGEYIQCDSNMLRTTLRNLLSNAIKYSYENTVIEILVQKNDSKNEFTFSVTDTGIGISTENIPKIFDISLHHSAPGTNDEKGTGLGLMLCKEFVERHGGTIGVESTLGHGSTFRFNIPQ